MPAKVSPLLASWRTPGGIFLPVCSKIYKGRDFCFPVLGRMIPGPSQKASPGCESSEVQWESAPAPSGCPRDGHSFSFFQAILDASLGSGTSGEQGQVLNKWKERALWKSSEGQVGQAVSRVVWAEIKREVILLFYHLNV